MTAKVFNLSPAFKKKQAKTVEKKTPFEIFEFVSDDVITEWRHFAVKNRLSEYVQAKIPETAKPANGGDSLNDLNVISHVEQRLGISASVFCPGATDKNPNGWMAGFTHNAETFFTPSDMSSEATARTLNILLFMAFYGHLKVSGRE